MIRTLLIVSLLAVPAVAQTPPPNVPPKPKPLAAPAEKPPSFDQIVAAAVNASPEVKIAEAEVAMAAAKLNAAKVAAAKQVTALKDSLDQANAELAAANATIAMHQTQYDKQKQLLERLRNGGADLLQTQTAEKNVQSLEADMQKSKAALTIAATRLNRLESDWKRFRDEVPQSALHGSSVLMSDYLSQLAWQRANNQSTYLDLVARTTLAGATAAAGPQADLRAALDKMVEVQEMEGDVPTVTAELLRKAGYQGHVKYPRAMDPAMIKTPPKARFKSGAMPLGSWLHLLADEVSDPPFESAIKDTPRYDFYVRDYGLQLATKETAAPGAIPLSTFWKTPKSGK